MSVFTNEINPMDRENKTMSVNQINFMDDEPRSVDESVHHPDHYNGRECMDMLIKMGVGKEGCVFNIVKYLWRWEKKDGLRDLKKAQWYLNELINLMENK